MTDDVIMRKGPPGTLPPGTFTVSLDLESYWGVFDKRTVASYAAHLDGIRHAVDGMLGLFCRYGVRATWATVGLLMCSDYDEAAALAPAPAARPRYDDPRLSAYPLLARRDRSLARYLFAPDLVERVRQREGQELATHTFAHVYALEAGMTPEAFAADLAAAKRVGDARGVSYSSIVFPRNQYDDTTLRVCASAGLHCYRAQPQHTLYRPRRDGDQNMLVRAGRLVDAHVPFVDRSVRVTAGGANLVASTATAFLRPAGARSGVADVLQLRRVLAELRRAARCGTDVHLWWHPHNFGAAPEHNLERLEVILRHARALSCTHGLRMMTMAEHTARRMTEHTVWPTTEGTA